MTVFKVKNKDKRSSQEAQFIFSPFLSNESQLIFLKRTRKQGKKQTPINSKMSAFYKLASWLNFNGKGKANFAIIFEKTCVFIVSWWSLIWSPTFYPLQAKNPESQKNSQLCPPFFNSESSISRPKNYQLYPPFFIF